MSAVTRPSSLLDPGLCLTLRPMAYPGFFDMYRDAIKNTWTVDEVDFSRDVADLHAAVSPAERHLIERLVAFFATGDSIVANNVVLSLYRHINAPEARMYLSRQLYEEALHVQFYLTLLDTYIPDPAARHRAFAAIESIPSIQRKADFLLCRLRRGAVLLRGVRLRVLPALPRPAAGTRERDKLGLPRRERAHAFCVQSRRYRMPRGTRPVRRRASSAGESDGRRGG
jgi:hypothetical protein